MTTQINVIPILNLLIDELNIPVTRQGIKNEVLKHPKSNSLLAISEILESWNVSNSAYHLSFDELIEANISAPYIAFVRYERKQEFTLVKYIDEKRVVVSNKYWSNHQLSIDDFKEKYGGTILVAKKEANSGETDYARKHTREVLDKLSTPVFITGITILLLSFLIFHTSYIANINWQIALLILFKTVGVTVGIILLAQAIDSNNPLVEKLCGTDPTRNCGAILSSKAAKINDYLTWSEVGFFYFSSTWLILIFNSNSPGLMSTLAILNAVSVPYTFYSIYYQWRVAKQWCLFCCVVQGLLWLEFITFFPYFQSGLYFPELKEWNTLLICMILPILIWKFISPYLKRSSQIPLLVERVSELKSDMDLFHLLLNQKEKFTLLTEEDSIVLGNRNAETTVTVVSNLHCSECAKAHKILDEWLSRRSDLKLQIVFPLTNIKTDPRTPLAMHLMSLQESQSNSSTKDALHDWYLRNEGTLGSYEPWAKDHPVTLKDYTHALEKQKQWCDMVDTKVTPVIYINGRRLPKTHQLNDIKYLI
jgi:uncharacterized membrane protein